MVQVGVEVHTYADRSRIRPSASDPLARLAWILTVTTDIEKAATFTGSGFSCVL